MFATVRDKATYNLCSFGESRLEEEKQIRGARMVSSCTEHFLSCGASPVSVRFKPTPLTVRRLGRSAEESIQEFLSPKRQQPDQHYDAHQGCQPTSGMCPLCIRECSFLCEIGLSAFRGREVLYLCLDWFGDSTAGALNTTWTGTTLLKNNPWLGPLGFQFIISPDMLHHIPKGLGHDSPSSPAARHVVWPKAC